MSCEIADYLFEKTRQTFLIWLCPVCNEQITEIDGERVVDCKCREEEADKEKDESQKGKIIKKITKRKGNSSDG